jgi:Domain of Unknown Function (DUF748)
MLIAGMGGVVLIAGLALAWWWAVQRLHAAVEDALGPRASLQSATLGWRGVRLQGLAVQGEPGRWPASHELRAKDVLIVPEWTSGLAPGPWRIARVEVRDGYLALLRPRSGPLRVMPSLQARRAEHRKTSAVRPVSTCAEPSPSTESSLGVHIGQVVLHGMSVEFFDATVPGTRSGPHAMRFDGVQGTVGPLALPALNEPISIDLQAAVAGKRHTGNLTLEGQLTPASRDARLALRARGVDLTALQPYLLPRGDASVRSGRLDLQLDARVDALKLQAPGHLVLHDLQLDGDGSVFGTFAGVPRAAVLAALSRDGKIELDFTLQGRVDDPRFSINQVFAVQFAVGLAEKLGVSVGGAVEGLTQAIKGLFGK